MYKLFRNPYNVFGEEKNAKYIINDGYMYIYPLGLGINMHRHIAEIEGVPFHKVEGGGNLKVTCWQEFLLITTAHGCSEDFGCPVDFEIIHKELLECRTVTYINGQYYKIETIDEYKKAQEFSNDFRFMHIAGLEDVYKPFNEFVCS